MNEENADKTSIENPGKIGKLKQIKGAPMDALGQPRTAAQGHWGSGPIKSGALAVWGRYKNFCSDFRQTGPFPEIPRLRFKSKHSAIARL
ncbi:MAG: hypothetical protein AB1405_15430 [Bdellovibrionota bacterium]